VNLSSLPFNLIDALLVAIVLLGLFNGWRKGFVLGALDLLVLVASVLAAFWTYAWGAALLQRYTSLDGAWAQPLAFMGLWLVVRVLLGAVAGVLVRAFPRAAHAHAVNRALGLAPGLVGGAINAAIVALLLLAVPLMDGLTRYARGSLLAGPLAMPAERVETALAPIFQGAVTRTLGRMTVRPGSRETVSLAYTVQDAPARPELEAQMLDLVNQERARAGLPPLRADPELTAVARAHSRDMLARGYFSHVAPDGKDPFDRLRQAGVSYRTAGENLALAPTLAMAHRGLMNSPGHKANILRPAFGRVGIGIVDGGRRGLMATQNFRN